MIVLCSGMETMAKGGVMRSTSKYCMHNLSRFRHSTLYKTRNRLINVIARDVLRLVGAADLCIDEANKYEKIKDDREKQGSISHQHRRP